MLIKIDKEYVSKLFINPDVYKHHIITLIDDDIYERNKYKPVPESLKVQNNFIRNLLSSPNEGYYFVIGQYFSLKKGMFYGNLKFSPCYWPILFEKRKIYLGSFYIKSIIE